MSKTTYGLSTQRIARIGVIAAIYAACTLVAVLFLGGLAWGPIQFRVSEALTILSLFSADAVPGLTLGCVVANVANIALSGTGTLGLLDVVFGSLATFVGAYFTYKMRKHPAVAVIGPVLANALIVPAYLPVMLAGLGFYTIPFTSISLEGSYLYMYLFGLVTTGAGEAAVLYILGLPFAQALTNSPVPAMLSEQDGSSSDANPNISSNREKATTNTSTVDNVR